MKQHAVFIDVDGTLCSDAGEIPISAIQAIQEARKWTRYIDVRRIQELYAFY